jgi:hypothetical protein
MSDESARLPSYYLPQFSRLRLLSDLATLATALVLGFLHALEIDHMLAVTAFVSRRPPLATAAGFGLRWGVGHSLAVLALGGILLATGVRWPEQWTRYGEAGVGLMLTPTWSPQTRNLHSIQRRSTETISTSIRTGRAGGRKGRRAAWTHRRTNGPKDRLNTGTPVPTRTLTTTVEGSPSSASPTDWLAQVPL